VLDSHEALKNPLHLVSVDSITSVGTDPILLLLYFHVFSQCFYADLVVVCSHLQLEESIHATHVLFFKSLQLLRLEFLLSDSFHKLADVILLCIQVHLVVVLVFRYVYFFASLYSAINFS